MQKLDKVMSYLLEQMPPPDTLKTTIANLKNDIAIWEDKLKNGTDKEKQLARLILPDKREQLRRSLMVAKDIKNNVDPEDYPHVQQPQPPPKPLPTPRTPPQTPPESDVEEIIGAEGGVDDIILEIE